MMGYVNKNCGSNHDWNGNRLHIFWLISKETQIPAILLSASYSKKNTLFWYLRNIFSVNSQIITLSKSGQVNFRLMATDSKEKTIFKIKICCYYCISEASDFLMDLFWINLQCQMNISSSWTMHEMNFVASTFKMVWN